MVEVSAPVRPCVGPHPMQNLSTPKQYVRLLPVHSPKHTTHANSSISAMWPPCYSFFRGNSQTRGNICTFSKVVGTCRIKPKSATKPKHSMRSDQNTRQRRSVRSKHVPGETEAPSRPGWFATSRWHRKSTRNAIKKKTHRTGR